MGLKIKKDNRFKVMSFFSGVGGIELGLPHDLFRVVGFSENDENCNAVLRRHWPNVKNYGDINKIDIGELPTFDVLTAGFPCFVAGTLITTINGQKPIEEIEIGDFVLTHNANYKSVIQKFKKYKAPTRIIKRDNEPDIETTDEHPFYCIDRTKVTFENMPEPEWIKAKNIVPGRHLSLCFDGGNLISYKNYSYREIIDNRKTKKRKIVFNIGVEEDESYCAEGAIVHNCQDVSISGQRRGLEGRRTGLFFKLLDVLKTKRPKYFILENVKGLFSSNAGWDFARVQVELASAGYDSKWLLLNAKNCGVPQIRERIFFVGYLRGASRQEILSEREFTDEKTFIRSLFKKDPRKNELQNKKRLKLFAYSKSGRDEHIDHRARINLYANTLSTGLGCGFQSSFNLVLDKNNFRRLTPLECERLMSWPDNYTEYGVTEFGGKIKMTDTKRYKMIGNGVVSQCVRFIINNHFFKD